MIRRIKRQNKDTMLEIRIVQIYEADIINISLRNVPSTYYFCSHILQSCSASCRILSKWLELGRISGLSEVFPSTEKNLDGSSVLLSSQRDWPWQPSSRGHHVSDEGTPHTTKALSIFKFVVYEDFAKKNLGRFGNEKIVFFLGSFKGHHHFWCLVLNKIMPLWKTWMLGYNLWCSTALFSVMPMWPTWGTICLWSRRHRGPATTGGCLAMISSRRTAGHFCRAVQCPPLSSTLCTQALPGRLLHSIGWDPSRYCPDWLRGWHY